MQLFTVGFTQTSAEEFFTKLKSAQVRRLIDVRLNNKSQLAGFTKKTDLSYFLETLCDISYDHLIQLAPTREMFNAYRKNNKSWRAYAQEFRLLMAERKIEMIGPEQMDGACLLCSEKSPDNCHRRLIGEYLTGKWQRLEVIHL